MNIATALALVAALAVAMPARADARARHGSKRGTHVTRHVPSHRAPAGVIFVRPFRAPDDEPGYRYRGPFYSTCDRINADRMLVGTCR